MPAARHLYPAAPLERKLYDKTLRMADQACAALGCEGAPRVDFRVTAKGKPYVLEVNTLPGMTALSLLPEIARSKGIFFPDLVENILDHASLKTKLEH